MNKENLKKPTEDQLREIANKALDGWIVDRLWDIETEELFAKILEEERKKRIKINLS